MEDRCADCGCELKVAGSRYVVKNDGTPDLETRLFAVLSMECANPQCVSYKKRFDEAIEQRVESDKPVIEEKEVQHADSTDAAESGDEDH